MKLYHYAPRKNTVLTAGLFSFSAGYGSENPYIKRAGGNERKKILSWMEKTFPGRSRAISVITEPIRWENNDPMLKDFVENHTLFSFELEDLLKDGIIESIWCQKDDTTYPIEPKNIIQSPLPWEKCNRAKGLFFKVIPHYFIVLKKGGLPSKYIRQEKF